MKNRCIILANFLLRLKLIWIENFSYSSSIAQCEFNASLYSTLWVDLNVARILLLTLKKPG